MESIIRMLELADVVEANLYDNAIKYSDKLYGVMKGSKIGLVDTSGKLLIDVVYDLLIPKYGFYFLGINKDYVHIYDLKGQRVCDKEFKSKIEALKYLCKSGC